MSGSSPVKIVSRYDRLLEEIKKRKESDVSELAQAVGMEEREVLDAVKVFSRYIPIKLVYPANPMARVRVRYEG